MFEVNSQERIRQKHLLLHAFISLDGRTDMQTGSSPGELKSDVPLTFSCYFRVSVLKGILCILSGSRLLLQYNLCQEKKISKLLYIPILKTIHTIPSVLDPSLLNHAGHTHKAVTEGKCGFRQKRHRKM